MNAAALNDENAARIGREVLQMVANLAPLKEELAPQIQPIMERFDFERCAALLYFVPIKPKPSADELRKRGMAILQHLCEEPKRTLVRDEFLTGMRLGYELILVLNLTCSHREPQQPAQP